MSCCIRNTVAELRCICTVTVEEPVPLMEMLPVLDNLKGICVPRAIKEMGLIQDEK